MNEHSGPRIASPVFRYAVYKTNDTGKDLNAKFFDQPWHVFNEHSKKPRVEVARCDCLTYGQKEKRYKVLDELQDVCPLSGSA